MGTKAAVGSVPWSGALWPTLWLGAWSRCAIRLIRGTDSMRMIESMTLRLGDAPLEGLDAEVGYGDQIDGWPFDCRVR